MKLNVLRTLMVWALTSPFLFSQNGIDRPVTIAFADLSIYDALLKLESASDLPFSYNSDVLPDDRVSGSWKQVPLRSVLEEMLPPVGLKYTYQDGIVIIKPGRRILREKRYNLSGYVEDMESGERLIGASVYDAISGTSALTNEFGFFNLQLVRDSVKLLVSTVGYDISANKFLLSKDVRAIFRLRPNLILPTVEINAEDEALMESEMGGVSSVSIPMDELMKLPALMGESDVFAGLSLLPGVNSGGDGAAGLYVRGGGPDQNLVLYDGVPIYNSSHLFGFYSIFNSSAIKDVELVKGGFPARYGGRLSSVINIRMKEGNQNRIAGQGNIGLTSANLLLEGPLIKDKVSFVASARRTLLEPTLAVVSNISEQQEGNELGYFLYDLHGKISWKVSERDRIFVTGYQGADQFSSGYDLLTAQRRDQLDFNLSYGNRAGIARWHRDWSAKVFSDVSLYTTEYTYWSESVAENDSAGVDMTRNVLKNSSSVQDYGARIQVDYLPTNGQIIRVGGAVILHEFQPEIFQQRMVAEGGGGDPMSREQPILRPLEANVFIEDQLEVNDYISLNAGLHNSFYTLESSNFFSLQPRISFRIGPADRWGFTGSYTNMTQFQHLLSNSGTGLPTDLFVPATDKIPPQTARQFSLGLDKNFESLGLQVSLEGYHKEMKNLIDYQTGTNFLVEAPWQDLVERDGTGTSYGLETFIRKPVGRFRGFLGYTWSKTTRQFPTINDGNPFPYKYDRRHDLSLALIFELNDRWEFSTNWLLSSGTMQTFPAAVYFPPANQNFDFLSLNTQPGQNFVIVYAERNSFRLPTYHRLDLNVRHYRTRKWGETFWNFGAYNAYNRRNPYFLFLRADYSEDPNGGGNGPGVKARKLTLLPVLPYVNFGFRF